MITITRQINLYRFDELSEEIQNLLKTRTAVAWMENKRLVPLKALKKYLKACKTAEDLQTPWFCQDYILEFCEKEITKEYQEGWYLEDGTYDNYDEFNPR